MHPDVLKALACPTCGKPMIRAESFWVCGASGLMHGGAVPDGEMRTRLADALAAKGRWCFSDGSTPAVIVNTAADNARKRPRL